MHYVKNYLKFYFQNRQKRFLKILKSRTNK